MNNKLYMISFNTILLGLILVLSVYSVLAIMTGATLILAGFVLMNYTLSRRK